MGFITVTQVKDRHGEVSHFASTIKVEDIRCFYARRDGSLGTRITFRDGGGFAVLDSVDAIREAIAAKFTNLKFVALTQIKGGYYMDESHIPTVVNVDAIRNFYPRHEGKPGTRLTFDDGGGFAITETYDHVLQAVTDGSDHVVLPTPEVPQPLQLVHDADATVEEEDEEEEDDFA